MKERKTMAVKIPVDEHHFENNILQRDLLHFLPFEIRCEVEENIQRKNFTQSELYKIQEYIRAQLTKKFQQGRKIKTGNHFQNENCQQVGTLASAGLKRIDDLNGKIFGESGETTRRRRVVMKAFKNNDKKFAKLITNVDAGKTSLSYAYLSVKRNEDKQCSPLPKNKFDLILADPPWEYDSKLSGSPSYGLMSLEEICKLEVPSADNCVLFLWTTNPKLETAFEVIKSWGFQYKTNITWVKTVRDNLRPRMGLGYYVRGAHEILLIAVRGKPGIPVECDRPVSVIQSPLTVHSEKPEESYKIIEKMYPHSKKIELFARRTRENWTSWGNEVEG
jgi:N6-adenosine-specific RNA methylase IME4